MHKLNRDQCEEKCIEDDRCFAFEYPEPNECFLFSKRPPVGISVPTGLYIFVFQMRRIQSSYSEVFITRTQAREMQICSSYGDLFRSQAKIRFPLSFVIPRTFDPSHFHKNCSSKRCKLCCSSKFKIRYCGDKILWTFSIKILRGRRKFFRFMSFNLSN